MDYLTSPTSRHSREAKTLIDFLLPSAPGQPSGAMAAVVYTNYLIPSLIQPLSKNQQLTGITTQKSVRTIVIIIAIVVILLVLIVIFLMASEKISVARALPLFIASMLVAFARFFMSNMKSKR